MKTELHEIKIGSEFLVFKSAADALAAAGAVMRGARTVSAGRGITLEPVQIDVGRRMIDVSRASVQRALGRD